MRCFFVAGIVFLFCLLSVSAQVFEQRGVVRMITNSNSSPVTPIKGVKVVVGNSVSKPSEANGAVVLKVTKQFKINNVNPEGYILALPTRGKVYNRTPNNVMIVVTTKAQKEADYKRLYQQIKTKYDEQYDELRRLKALLQSRLDSLTTMDAKYNTLKMQRDSVQSLCLDYINNEERMDKEIRKIAEELSVTDYQTLDSLDQRIYDLKCQGEWKSISDLLMNDVIKGDVKGYLQKGKDNVSKAEATLQGAKDEDNKAEEELDKRLGVLKPVEKQATEEKQPDVGK